MAGRVFGIGEVARRAGVSPDLVRYYERVGLMPPAPRTAGGLRYYSEDSLERLRFVRNAIRFGFSARQLAGFLKAKDSGRPPCQAVCAAGERLLTEMDEEIAALRVARDTFAATVAAWKDRLAHTPPGTAAHLLTMVPETQRLRRTPPRGARK